MRLLDDIRDWLDEVHLPDLGLWRAHRWLERLLYLPAPTPLDIYAREKKLRLFEGAMRFSVMPGLTLQWKARQPLLDAILGAQERVEARRFRSSIDGFGYTPRGPGRSFEVPLTAERIGDTLNHLADAGAFGPTPKAGSYRFWDEKNPEGGTPIPDVEPKPRPGGTLVTFSSTQTPDLIRAYLDAEAARMETGRRLRVKTLIDRFSTIDFSDLLAPPPPSTRAARLLCRTCSNELDLWCLALAGGKRGPGWFVDLVLAWCAGHVHKAYTSPRAFRALCSTKVRDEIVSWNRAFRFPFGFRDLAAGVFSPEGVRTAPVYHGISRSRVDPDEWTRPPKPVDWPKVVNDGIERIGSHDIEESLRRAPEEQARRHRDLNRRIQATVDKLWSESEADFEGGAVCCPFCGSVYVSRLQAALHRCREEKP